MTSVAALRALESETATSLIGKNLVACLMGKSAKACRMGSGSMGFGTHSKFKPVRKALGVKREKFLGAKGKGAQGAKGLIKKASAAGSAKLARGPGAR